jgi:hypothetical protein
LRPWCQQAQSPHLRQAGKPKPPESVPMMTADRSRVAGPPRQLLGGYEEPKGVHVGTMQMVPANVPP